MTNEKNSFNLYWNKAFRKEVDKLKLAYDKALRTLLAKGLVYLSWKSEYNVKHPTSNWHEYTYPIFIMQETTFYKGEKAMPLSRLTATR